MQIDCKLLMHMSSYFFGGIYKPWNSNRISIGKREKTHCKWQERKVFLLV